MEELEREKEQAVQGLSAAKNQISDLMDLNVDL